MPWPGNGHISVAVKSLCAKEGSLDISDESFVRWQEASIAR